MPRKRRHVFFAAARENIFVPFFINIFKYIVFLVTKLFVTTPVHRAERESASDLSCPCLGSPRLLGPDCVPAPNAGTNAAAVQGFQAVPSVKTGKTAPERDTHSHHIAMLTVRNHRADGLTLNAGTASP
ncbi:hypothetical protein CNY67_15485 [Desulfovibrio sp. G11]|nr:hypothetical protein CNY67_15485 [Desulfovibrio sp. G11]